MSASLSTKKAPSETPEEAHQNTIHQPTESIHMSSPTDKTSRPEDLQKAELRTVTERSISILLAVLLTTLEPTRPGKDRKAWVSGQLKTVIHDLQETLHRLRPPY